MILQFIAHDEQKQCRFGAALAICLQKGMVVYLSGDLGAGKTTFTRGFLQGLGYTGNVKSPTYTLVESYEFAQLTVYHFDLYRLQDPEELELMGIRDYFNEQSIVIVEWPSKGEPLLPPADIIINMSIVPQGRTLIISASNDKAQQVLSHFQIS
ncbi:MAG TPA: tRNA (adenosine(37)-N6)-threonylcarbamoyltransferase complex ATPase subunit type 1 TsaE [Agitococcus sp.]|nr:tRNA (adenosine(37)-N6)-threonylcarbamoyltransferase complex ATPase subunit type 1 TsaE [Agitococcus sp.]